MSQALVISTLFVFPSPNLSITLSKNIICKDSTLIITASGAYSYTWTTPNGVYPFNYVTPTPSVIGAQTYSVAGTLTNGCYAYSSITFTVIDCSILSGLTNHEIVDGIEIFPNPNNGNFTLKLNAASKVSIYNNLGELISKESYSEGRTEVALQHKAKGIYFITVENIYMRKVFRMIIE